MNMNEKLTPHQPPLTTGSSYSETPLKFEPDNIGALSHGKVGWICPICGRALSPDTICCPFCWGNNTQPTCIIYGTGDYVNPNCNTSINSTMASEGQNTNTKLEGGI